MNIEQIAELKRIVDGAGSGHVAVGLDGYMRSTAVAHVLSDLRTIIAQHEEIERLKQELTSTCYLNDELSAYLNQLREQSK